MLLEQASPRSPALADLMRRVEKIESENPCPRRESDMAALEGEIVLAASETPQEREAAQFLIGRLAKGRRRAPPG